jgi:hypothetical protein
MPKHGEIPVPGSGGAGTDTHDTGENSMPDSDNVPNGDLSNDCLELLLDQQFEAFDNLMVESAGNASGAHSIVRYSGARKFNQEDPIEAAATEMILNKS